MTRPLVRLVPVVAAAALAGALLPGAVGSTSAVGSVPTTTTADSAAEPAVLTVLAAPRAEMYADGGRAYGDLGIRLAASGGPVEIRTRRFGWGREPQTRVFPGGWVDGTSRWADGVEAPRSMVRGFDRLAGLVRVTVRDADDDVVARRTIDGCLNSYDAQRTTPDSPPDPYYPTSCARGELTLGSVQGIQEGYGVSPEDWSRLPLGAGRYSVSATVDAAWGDLLGVTDRTVSYTLHVRDEGRQRVDALRAAHREGSETAAPPAEPGPRPDGSDTGTGARGMSDMGGMTHSVATEPCAYTPGAEDPLPDLESLPAFGIQASGQDLRFSATVWNAGDSPLVVDGYRRSGRELMDAYQYFYSRDGEGRLVEEAYCKVGAMHWHSAPSHHHWHFLDFARYRLLDADDPSVVVRSTKQSFCLANTDATDYTRPGADWRPDGTDLSSACGARSAQSLRQVLSAGSGDTYVQYRAGQAFRLNGLDDGWYLISVEANPRDLLHESADEMAAKDVALRRVHIGTDADGDRTVRVPPKGLLCGQPRGCD